MCLVRESVRIAIYDPDRNELSGWLRTEGFLDLIESMVNWISPRLNIRFTLADGKLQIYHPNGSHFLSYTEIAKRAEQERQRAEHAEERAARLAERLRAMGIDPEQI